MYSTDDSPFLNFLRAYTAVQNKASDSNASRMKKGRRSISLKVLGFRAFHFVKLSYFFIEQLL